MPAPSASPTADGEAATLAELEKRHILATLERCNGNRTHAARVLDISIRTLRNKLNEYSGKTALADGDSDEEPMAAAG
jgi:DNA-binding NtrC family response regulator